jgi:hypothetical protein
MPVVVRRSSGNGSPRCVRDERPRAALAAGRSPGSPVGIDQSIRAGPPLRGQPRHVARFRAGTAFPFHPPDANSIPSGGHLRCKFYNALV